MWGSLKQKFKNTRYGRIRNVQDVPFRNTFSLHSPSALFVATSSHSKYWMFYGRFFMSLPFERRCVYTAFTSARTTVPSGPKNFSHYFTIIKYLPGTGENQVYLFTWHATVDFSLWCIARILMTEGNGGDQSERSAFS